MTYYDGFDCKANCEDFNQVTEDEYNEVMQMMAEETEGYTNLPTDEQQVWEAEQDRAKDWLGSYTNVDKGKFYGAIAV